MRSYLKELIFHEIYHYPEKGNVVFSDDFHQYCDSNSLSSFYMSYTGNNHNNLLSSIMSERILVLQKVVELFNKNNIEYCLTKGFYLSTLLYGDPFFRPGTDIDFLVKESDGIKAVSCIKKIAKQEYIGKDCTPYPILLDDNAHEYREFYLIENPNQEFEIGIALHNIRGEHRLYEFFKTKEIFPLSDFEVNVFDKLHTFIYLCTNIYNDDETKEEIKARNYIDLGRFINLYYQDINLSQLNKEAKYLDVIHCIYYALSNLNIIVQDPRIECILKTLEIDSVSDEIKKIIVTENFGLCSWDNDILGRMLQPKQDRIEERQFKLRLRNNSKKRNMNFNQPIFLKVENDLFHKNTAYNSFYIQKYCFEFKYSFFVYNDLLVLMFPFDKDIHDFLPRFTINISLISPDTRKNAQIYRIQTQIKYQDSRWSKKTYKNLLRVFISNPRHFEDDLLFDQDLVFVKEEQKLNGYYAFLFFDIKKIFSMEAAPYFLYKIWLQEDIRVEDSIYVHKNLIEYSDNCNLYQCKNEVSIDLTYPQVICFPNENNKRGNVHVHHRSKGDLQGF